MNYKAILFCLLGLITFIGGISGLALSLTIQYRILHCVHADEFTWILYWVYAPLSIGVNLIAQATMKLSKTLESNAT